jgi:hypothetical protein
VVGFTKFVVVKLLNAFGYFDQLEPDVAGTEAEPQGFWSGALLHLKSIFRKGTSSAETIEPEPAPSGESHSAGNVGRQDSVVVSRQMAFFGSARTVGLVDSEDEDDSLDRLDKPGAPSFPARAASFLLFPALWLWNSACSVISYAGSFFRPAQGQSSAASQPQPSRHRTSPGKQPAAESAGAASAGWLERILLFVSGGDNEIVVDDDSAAAKPYIEIPSDSLGDERVEHQTTGNGSFVAQKFRKAAGNGSALAASRPVMASKRGRIACCCLPWLLLLPLLLLPLLCQYHPDLLGDKQTCQTVAHVSSQFSEKFFDFSASFSKFLFNLPETTFALFGSWCSEAANFFESGFRILKDGFLLGVDRAGAAVDTVTSQLLPERGESAAEWSSTTFLYVSECVSGSLVAATNFVFAIFSSAVHLFSWTWSFLWSLVVNLLFGVISIAKWFTFSAPAAGPGLDVATPATDQIVQSILESSRFRAFVDQKSGEHFDREQSNFQRRLDDIFTAFSDQFRADKSGFEDAVRTTDDDLKLLRQTILARLSALADSQDQFSIRLQEQEQRASGTLDLGGLDAKLDQLKEGLLKDLAAAAGGDEDSGRQVELRLSEIRARLDKLEADLASLKVEAVKCCNATFVRDLATAHVEKWLQGSILRNFISAEQFFDKFLMENDT